MHTELHVSLRRDQSGVSLIEVMISMLLLSVALLGIAVAFPQSRVAVQGSSQITTATNLARQTLEHMRNRRYSSTVDQITARISDSSVSEMLTVREYERNNKARKTVLEAADPENVEL